MCERFGSRDFLYGCSQMNESGKAVCAVLMIAGVIATLLSWMIDRPDAATWGFRIGGPLLALLTFSLLLRHQLRSDLERDYLRFISRNYFNRDGLCFAFSVTTNDQVAVMNLYFQSQYDKPLQGRIALRPAHGFFLTRAKIEAMTFDVACPPAAFGVVCLPVPIPHKIQGKRQAFEVGASVQYPEGKGRRIRFRDGIFLRANSHFGNTFGTALALAGAATGSLVLTRPATVSLQLPIGVTEEIPQESPPESRVLWQLGDPALEMRA